MDNAERKLLWRGKKKSIKEVFRKHGIRKYEDSKIEEQLRNKDLRGDIWTLGFSDISYHTIWLDDSNTQIYGSVNINRCPNVHPCEDCVSPEARDIAEIYSDELFDRLPEDWIESSRWLWLHVDRQNWAPEDFNFIVSPSSVAHRKWKKDGTNT